MVNAANPYEQDSDHEYRALEADAADERNVENEAEELADVDMNAINAGDDALEDAYPSERKRANVKKSWTACWTKRRTVTRRPSPPIRLAFILPIRSAICRPMAGSSSTARRS